RRITEAGGDYLLTVKENQGHLYEDILDCFCRAIESDFAGVEHDRYETEEHGHGRHEKRCYEVIYSPQGIRDEEEWAKLCVIGHCYSERTEGGKTSCEDRYFIGSRRAKAPSSRRGVRGPLSDREQGPLAAGRDVPGGRQPHPEPEHGRELRPAAAGSVGPVEASPGQGQHRHQAFQCRIG